MIDYKNAERVINAIPLDRVTEYLAYWQGILPKDYQDYYERWLFAYLSVRQRWQDNVRNFLVLRELGTDFTRKQLAAALHRTRSGMYKVRTNGIWAFHKAYWKSPLWWRRQPDETFTVCRERLSARAFGLGRAKIAFVLEMVHPEDCNVVCIDSHLLQVYGLKGVTKVPQQTYLAIEHHWAKTCLAAGCPSPMARHYVWDMRQGYQSTAYWSYVFEPTQVEGVKSA